MTTNILEETCVWRHKKLTNSENVHDTHVSVQNRTNRYRKEVHEQTDQELCLLALSDLYEYTSSRQKRQNSLHTYISHLYTDQASLLHFPSG